MGTHRGVTSEPGFTQEPLLLLSALEPLPQGAEERGPGLIQPPPPRTIEMRTTLESTSPLSPHTGSWGLPLPCLPGQSQANP